LRFPNQLYTLVQPETAFAVFNSNPVDTTVAYGGDSALFGQANDPMVGKRVGGVNVLAASLYSRRKNARRHWSAAIPPALIIISREIRNVLNLDTVPGGFSKKIPAKGMTISSLILRTGRAPVRLDI
jgi:hypothetical protein